MMLYTMGLQAETMAKTQKRETRQYPTYSRAASIQQYNGLTDA